MSKTKMGRPRTKDANVIVKSVKLSKSMIHETDKIMKKERLTFGELVRKSLELYMETYKKDDSTRSHHQTK